MACATCTQNNRVVETRNYGGYILRRRQCRDCFTKFSTVEVIVPKYMTVQGVRTAVIKALKSMNEVPKFGEDNDKPST